MQMIVGLLRRGLALNFGIRFFSKKFRENYFVTNFTVFYHSFTKGSVLFNSNKKFIDICLPITPEVKITINYIFYKYLVIISMITAWKVSVFRVFLVRIFQHSDWIRRNLSGCSLNARKRGQENFWIRTLFTQWIGLHVSAEGQVGSAYQSLRFPYDWMDN